MERRFSELRAEGRTLSGVAVTYGETARIGSFSERFEPGAFGDVSGLDVILNVQHQRARPIARTGGRDPGGGLTLIDSPESLRMRADLPPTREADDALALVRSRVLRGLSVEFRAIRDSWENGRSLRVIHEAKLGGLGLVDSPAYPGSGVEARNEVRQTPGGGLEMVFPLEADIPVSVQNASTIWIGRRALDASLARIAAGTDTLSVTLGSSYDRLLASSSNGAITALVEPLNLPPADLPVVDVPPRPRPVDVPPRLRLPRPRPLVAVPRAQVRVTISELLRTAASEELTSMLDEGVKVRTVPGLVPFESTREAFTGSDGRTWERERVTSGGLCEVRGRVAGGSGTTRRTRRRRRQRRLWI